MRTLWLLTALLLVSGVQAASLTGTTWTDPEEMTVNYNQFERDADGNTVRNEDGSLKRVEQTFTVHWDLELECASMQDAGDPWEVFAANIGEIAMTDSKTGEKAIIFDLSPDQVTVNWTRDGPLDNWHAEGSLQVTIVNEQASPTDRTLEYQWAANPWIANSCASEDFEYAPEFLNQTIFLPGVGFGPGDETGDGDDDANGTPAPVVPAALALVAVALLKKR